jgi:hypothetical protein
MPHTPLSPVGEFFAFSNFMSTYGVDSINPFGMHAAENIAPSCESTNNKSTASPFLIANFNRGCRSPIFITSESGNRFSTQTSRIWLMDNRRLFNAKISISDSVVPFLMERLFASQLLVIFPSETNRISRSGNRFLGVFLGVTCVTKKHNPMAAAAQTATRSVDTTSFDSFTPCYLLAWETINKRR